MEAQAKRSFLHLNVCSFDKAFNKGDVQKTGGAKVKVFIKVRNGIEAEVSKKIYWLEQMFNRHFMPTYQRESWRMQNKEGDTILQPGSDPLKDVQPLVLRAMPTLSFRPD